MRMKRLGCIAFNVATTKISSNCTCELEVFELAREAGKKFVKSLLKC